jgi:membrane protein DedA with SNARE-associated domain
MASLIAGFLVFRGYFNFFPAYGILILGDIIPDTIYYYIGRYGQDNFIVKFFTNKFTSLLGNKNVVKKIWENHTKKTMFLIKLAYGLSVPFIVSAGFAKVSYRKFISSAIFVTLVQYGLIMLGGYYLGQSYKLGGTYLEYTYIVITIILIIFVAFHAGFAKYAKKKIFRMEEEEAREQR